MPGAVLARVNDIADMYDVMELTSSCMAVVDPGSRVATWAQCGTPRPVAGAGHRRLRPSSGDPGMPARCQRDRRLHRSSCQVRPGGSPLLYTDGLVGRSSRPINDGLALRETVVGPHRDPEQLSEQVLTLLAGQSPTYDDVTLLGLRADYPADHRISVSESLF